MRRARARMHAAPAAGRTQANARQAWSASAVRCYLHQRLLIGEEWVVPRCNAKAVPSPSAEKRVQSAAPAGPRSRNTSLHDRVVRCGGHLGGTLPTRTLRQRRTGWALQPNEAYWIAHA